MRKEDIEERSKNLGVMDIRFGKNSSTLEDYSKVLDSVEKTHTALTDDLLKKARDSGSVGLKY